MKTLIQDLEKKHIFLTVAGENLILRGAKKHLTNAQIALIKAHKHEILHYLKNKKGQRESPIILRKGGQEQPLFLIHPVGGSVTCYFDLIAQLKPDIPVYGIQSCGLNDSLQPIGNLQQMTDLYMKEIQSVQKKGPYRLLGWSLGGCIAFEVAKKIQSCGETVSSVIMIDSFYRPNFSINNNTEQEKSILENFFQQFVLSAQLSVADDFFDVLYTHDLETGFSLLVKKAQAMGFIPQGFDNNRVQQFWCVFKENLALSLQCELGNYCGKVVLGHAEKTISSDFFSPPPGFEKLKPHQLKTLIIPGDHFSLLRRHALKDFLKTAGLHLD